MPTFLVIDLWILVGCVFVGWLILCVFRGSGDKPTRAEDISAWVFWISFIIAFVAFFVGAPYLGAYATNEQVLMSDVGVMGEHVLRPMPMSSGGNSSGPYLSAPEGTAGSEANIQFSWERGIKFFWKSENISSTLPYHMIRFVVDNSKAVPTIEFVFDPGFLEARRDQIILLNEKTNFNDLLVENYNYVSDVSGKSSAVKMLREAVIRISSSDLAKEVKGLSLNLERRIPPPPPPSPTAQAQLQTMGVVGSHPIRRIQHYSPGPVSTSTQNSSFSGNVSGAYFIIAGGGSGSISGSSSGSSDTHTPLPELQFFWGRTYNGEEEFLLTTLPYSALHFVMDDTKKTPTIDFVFDSGFLETTKNLGLTQATLNDWISANAKVAIVHISSKDMEDEVYLPQTR